MSEVLSEIVIASIDRMKDRIDWRMSEDIRSAVHGRYPHGAEVIISPNEDRTAFVAVAKLGERMFSTAGFIRCSMLKRIYRHAGGEL